MLPPIKIKLPDRNQDMSLHHQSPIKIKVKEIKKNAASDYQIPIKIKICDRDKDMRQAYEKRQAKVREKDGKIVVNESVDTSRQTSIFGVDYSDEFTESTNSAFDEELDELSKMFAEL